MKTLYWIAGGLVVLVGGFYAFNSYIYNEKQGEEVLVPETSVVSGSFEVVPITHATAVFKWGGSVIYTDPTGGAEAFVGQPSANIVLVTDIHGDHLSTSTLGAVVGQGAVLIVPQAVKDMLPEGLTSKARVLKNGETVVEQGFEILAMPMYNFPESKDSRHTRGRGNGYVISRDGYRVYVAGDTAGIPEMRALKDIDVAFVPMNLPYTMGVDEAASAVLEFKPKKVYPFHYRGQDGLADINKFKELVNAGDSTIEVVLANWYPNQ